MTLTVEPVRDRRDLAAFTRLPWSLYRDDRRWVPPLVGDFQAIFDRRKNPFFAHGEIEPFLARRDGEAVGRIAAIRNLEHERFHGESCGFFGFFEAIDDEEVTRALVGTARERVRGWGLSVLRGPVNPSTNDECGVLVDGFETSPALLMPHARPYYDGRLTAAGLVKSKDLIAYWLDAPDAIPERLVQGNQLARRRNPGVTFRPLDKRRFSREVELFKQVYNAAWERNWGFVPMTDAEIDHMAAQLKQAVDPGLVRIAEHDGRPVAFALALPDLNQALRHANGRLWPFGILKILWHARRVRTARVLVLGVVEGYRRRGLDVVLYHDLFEYGMVKGYTGAELSWVLEDNLGIRRPIESMGGRIHKTYRLYEMPTGARP